MTTTRIPRYFLIDDDMDDQEIFCMALKQIDETILCEVASDGVEALKILQTNTAHVPDFIFIDVNMPKMNGIQCLTEIKKLGHLTNTGVFMYSTTSDQKMVSKSKELGANDFIVKPASLSLLTGRLSEVLGYKKES